MTGTVIFSWIVGMVVCYWLGYRSGRARPDQYNIQQQLDQCRIQRLADGLYRVGDEYTHYAATTDGVASPVREQPRTPSNTVVQLVRVTG